MATTVWLRGPQGTPGKKGVPADGRVLRKIFATDASAETNKDAQPLAYPERTLPQGGIDAYRKARSTGHRAFTLWADAYRQRVSASVVTKSAAKGQDATYEVLGAAGESLAFVQREPTPNGGRTRWTVQQAGAPPVSGRKGRVFWWWVWWLISPIQLAIAIGSLIGGGDVARMPRRITWYDNGQKVLDWCSGGLEVMADWWDPRVTAGVVALLKSHDGVLGDSWDDHLTL